VAAKRKANGGNGAKPTGKPRSPNLRPPWTSETAPKSPGRPKGSRDIKGVLRQALETPTREGEKPPLDKAAGVIARKAARSPDFALRALDYLDPKTHVVDATSDVRVRADSDRFIPKADDQEALEALLQGDQVLH
jgi:hypothetical protein